MVERKVTQAHGLNKNMKLNRIQFIILKN